MADEETGFTFVDKRRVQADDAAEAAPPAATDEAVIAPDFGEDMADTEDDGAGPAPDVYGIIGYCISLLATEAWHKLGLLADPNTGEAVADLAQAKAAIDAAGDLAARLEAAPLASVPESLRRDLRTLINDLRLNYVAQRGDGATSRN